MEYSYAFLPILKNHYKLFYGKSIKTMDLYQSKHKHLSNLTKTFEYIRQNLYVIYRYISNQRKSSVVK